MTTASPRILAFAAQRVAVAQTILEDAPQPGSVNMLPVDVENGSYPGRDEQVRTIPLPSPTDTLPLIVYTRGHGWIQPHRKPGNIPPLAGY